MSDTLSASDLGYPRHRLADVCSRHPGAFALHGRAWDPATQVRAEEQTILVDLHGLGTEAAELVTDEVVAWIRSFSTTIRLVTGRGTHSRSDAVLPAIVSLRLTEYGIPFEDHDGHIDAHPPGPDAKPRGAPTKKNAREAVLQSRLSEHQAFEQYVARLPTAGGELIAKASGLEAELAGVASAAAQVLRGSSSPSGLVEALIARWRGIDTKWYDEVYSASRNIQDPYFDHAWRVLKRWAKRLSSQGGLPPNQLLPEKHDSWRDWSETLSCDSSECDLPKAEAETWRENFARLCRAVESQVEIEEQLDWLEGCDSPWDSVDGDEDDLTPRQALQSAVEGYRNGAILDHAREIASDVSRVAKVAEKLAQRSRKDLQRLQDRSEEPADRARKARERALALLREDQEEALAWLGAQQKLIATVVTETRARRTQALGFEREADAAIRAATTLSRRLQERLQGLEAQELRSSGQCAMLLRTLQVEATAASDVIQAIRQSEERADALLHMLEVRMEELNRCLREVEGAIPPRR